MIIHFLSQGEATLISITGGYTVHYNLKKKPQGLAKQVVFQLWEFCMSVGKSQNHACVQSE